MTGPFEGAARLRTKTAAVTVLGTGALLAVAACSGSGAPSSPGAAASAATATHSPVALSSGPASALQEQYQQVITTVLPSVVQINTETGTGSGVVYDSNGDIVTNAHVVGDATTVKVFPATGGATLQAKVLGTFTADDLAVIRVTSGAGSLSKATFGNSTNIAAGEIVLAMGNPLGLTGSVTQGIISATGRTVSEASASGGGSVTLADTLQTSAAINGGNSGGALVNLAGQVIGIPTAAARDPEAGAAPGIGFAIPSNTVINIADQLISTGKVTQSSRAALGITAHTTVTSDGQPAGVAISTVTAGGAAADAGLQPGDIITKVAGHETPTQGVLTAVLANLKPGQEVEVTYTRGSTSHTTKVTLGHLTS